MYSCVIEEESPWDNGLFDFICTYLYNSNGLNLSTAILSSSLNLEQLEMGFGTVRHGDTLQHYLYITFQHNS